MTDNEAFDAFYTASFAIVATQLRPLVGSALEAEEVVQEAFVRAYERWSRLSRYDNPEAWVHRVATRIAVSRWREFARRRKLWRLADEVEHDGATATGQERADVRQAVVTALRQLPRRQREVVVMFYLADMPVSAIAEEVGASESTVKSHLSRGRQRLREILGIT